MSDMFCFQCQQTAGNKGCVRTGVCGKQPATAHLQDQLITQLIRLAEAAERCGEHTPEASRLLIDGLFTTLTNVNFDDDAIRRFTDRVTAERDRLGGGETPVVDLWKGETDIVSLRSTLLFGMKGMAAYAHHALNLGCGDVAVTDWFYKGLCAVNGPHTVEQWLALIMEFGQVNFRCMALLDRANTGAFGDPVPTRVNTDIKKGPFIVVSGHDLADLAQLLESQGALRRRVVAQLEAPERVMRRKLVVDGPVERRPDIAEMDVAGVAAWRSPGQEGIETLQPRARHLFRPRLLILIAQPRPQPVDRAFVELPGAAVMRPDRRRHHRREGKRPRLGLWVRRRLPLRVHGGDQHILDLRHRQGAETPLAVQVPHEGLHTLHQLLEPGIESPRVRSSPHTLQPFVPLVRLHTDAGIDERTFGALVHRQTHGCSFARLHCAGIEIEFQSDHCLRRLHAPSEPD